MKRLPSNALATMLFTAVAAASLAACDRPGDERSAGQKIDAAVEQVQRKTEEVKADAREAGQETKAATETAVEAIADKTKDAVITTTINAELAKDTKLSALRVDVDTADGRVILRGTAPDTASRERATLLAQRVEGVKSVDNQLSVAPKG
jgi:osmotically-inducible protein OsmY